MPSDEPAGSTSQNQRQEQEHEQKSRHDELVEAIEAGGSVLHGRRIITRVDDLPSDAELEQHAQQQAAGWERLATAAPPPPIAPASPTGASGPATQPSSSAQSTTNVQSAPPSSTQETA